MSNAIPTPISLALSDDSALEAVLADIPFFCVGLMAFGVFTFVLVLKRANLVTLYLYSSSFLAFAAAVLDLAQILTRGATNMANGLGLDSVTGIVIAREVGLSLSLGSIYLFLWHLVAQRPRGEQPLSSEDSSTQNTHSASWKRWGLLGLLLKYGLLALTFSIPVLQIIWRVSTPSARFGTVYVAESTIEVVVSALFVLKLLLNAYLSPLTPWWRPLQSSVAPIIALFISTGLGLGNLVATAFSETTLGRFLRALEMYILILYTLISAFHGISSQTSMLPQHNPASLFQAGLSEKSRAITPVNNSIINVVRRSISSTDNIPKQSSRVSTMSRLSSWMQPRNARRGESSEQIWVQDRELGLASSNRGTVAPTEHTSPTAGEFQPLPTRAEVNMEDKAVLPEELLAPPKDRPFTAVSISSYYGMERDSIPYPFPPTLSPTRGTDSPVYGLNGIMGQRAKSRLDRDSKMSFDELLRQQTELDKSIAALRLFSRGSMLGLDESAPPSIAASPPQKPASSPKARSTSVSTNSYLGRRPDSASNRSEFSLSIFPEPPKVDTEEFVVSNSRFTGTRIPPREILVAEEPERADEVPSLPVSPHQFEGTRFGSAGTLYDVTSFIGGLTIPRSGSMLPSGGTVLSDVPSEDELTPTAMTTRPLPSSTLSSVRPMILTSSLLSQPAPAAVANPTERPQEVRTLKREPSIPLRPFFLGTTSQTLPVIMPSSTMVPIGGSRRGKGLPSGPRIRPLISGPTVADLDGRGDDAPGAFERPRPPPLRM